MSRRNKRRKWKNSNTFEINKVIVQATESNLINCAGLSAFINYCKKINFFKLIDARLHSPARSDGFLPSDFFKVFIALNFIYGNDSTLSKINLLRKNIGVAKILDMRKIPSESATGDFLHRYGNVETKKAKDESTNKNVRGGFDDGLKLMGDLFYEVALIAMQKTNVQNGSTLDFDAFIIEENKQYSKWTYKKNIKGTTGYGAFVDGVCVMAELEPGNHSPSDNIFERTKSCVELVEAGNIKIGKIREDAAGYVGDIINYCNENEMKFYIRAARDPGVKASVKTIKTLEEGNARGYKDDFLESCWKDTEIRVAGNDENKTSEVTLGVAVHAMERTAAFNLVTKRSEIIETKSEEPSTPLFPELPKIRHSYWSIATNDFESSAESVTEFYNKRGNDSENYNKELLLDFRVCSLPCRGEFGLEANRIFAYISGMLYNVTRMFKYECFEKKVQKQRLPTFCNSFIRIPAKVTQHGREVKLSLSTYMKNACKKIMMVIEKIKKEIKRYRIPAVSPEYMRLIFRLE